MKAKEQPKTQSFFEQISKPFEPTNVHVPYDTSNDIIHFKYNKGERTIFPAHRMADDFMFDTDEEHEAAMVHFMAKICDKNGMTKNDLMHVIPFVLRMLKSKSKWAE